MVYSAVLRVNKVTKRFGGVLALDRCTVEANQGEILSIIGPNGAGKTTLLNLISGIYRPDEGEIYVKGKRIDGLSPVEIFRLGVSRTFQIVKVYRSLSVLENMILPTIWTGLSREEVITRAHSLLKLVGLSMAEKTLSSKLSGGQQKLLEFARALMTDPDVVLLDEPFAGVHPEVKAQLCKALVALREKGKTLVIVTHDMETAVEISDKFTVLHLGRVISSGTYDEISRDRSVVEAYLGE